MRSASYKPGKPERQQYISHSNQQYNQEASRVHAAEYIENLESQPDYRENAHSSPEKVKSIHDRITKKVIRERDNEESDPNSILNRIQLNKRNNKEPRSINIRKGEDNGAEEFDIVSRIQRKGISKGPPKIITRPSARLDEEHNLKPDPYKMDGQTTVILNNLARNVTEQTLRDIIRNNGLINSIQIENGSATIKLKTAEVARRIVEDLDMNIIQGSKVRATLARELNLPSYLTERHRFDHLKTREGEEEQQEEQDEEDEEEDPAPERDITNELPIYFQRVHSKEVKEEEEEEKPSILSRIKKRQ